MRSKKFQTFYKLSRLNIFMWIWEKYWTGVLINYIRKLYKRFQSLLSRLIGLFWSFTCKKPLSSKSIVGSKILINIFSSTLKSFFDSINEKKRKNRIGCYWKESKYCGVFPDTITKNSQNNNKKNNLINLIEGIFFLIVKNTSVISYNISKSVSICQ